MTAAVGAANARNCDVPVKTRTGWGNKAKEIAADTGTPAKDPLDVMCAANCARPASTRISWASKAKEIAVGIARLAEVVNLHGAWKSGVPRRRLRSNLADIRLLFTAKSRHSRSADI
jgi:hypothetical protein